ncbi:MAG: serine acetyltransferase [Planctomycetes bacterium]|nr:serine acetyltransferase [Planctomycetota bacterium]
MMYTRVKTSRRRFPVKGRGGQREPEKAPAWGVDMSERPPQGNGEDLNEVVDATLRSYEDEGLLDDLSERPIPSLDDVTAILVDLRELLFPRHFNRRRVVRENIAYYIGDKIDQVYRALAEQIAKGFQHECPNPGREHQPCDLCMGRGRQESAAFLKKIPHLRKMFAEDLEAAFEGDPAAKSFDEIIFSYPGFRAVVVYRIAHELHVQSVPLLPRIMTEHAHSVTGVDIHPGATIGRRFFIDHATGVIIGETTQIGENVKIYQGVTLGAFSFPKGPDGKIIRDQKRHPTIEDNVTIYSGATILGPIVIGKGAEIGGNVWLTDPVPPGTKVVIGKPHLVYKITSREGYVTDYQI